MNEADKSFLTEWALDLLERRADKRWEPKLFAAPDVAEALVQVGPHIVWADTSCAPRSLQIRCAADVFDGESAERVFSEGEVMGQTQFAAGSQTQRLQ